MLQPPPEQPAKPGAPPKTGAQEERIEKKLALTEFGKTMKICDSSDKAEANHWNTDWSMYKNATKNRMLWRQLQKTHYYEYFLTFDLEKEVEISEVQLGMLYNWSTYDQDL